MDKREAITASNLGPVLSLLTWIMEAAVIMAVAVKFTLSYIIPGNGHRENFTLYLAIAFNIGFSVSMSIAVSQGIGRHQATLSPNQLESLQKAVYSANILFLLVLSCVQLSILIFLYDLTPTRFHHRLIYAMIGFVAVFTTASLFVAIFSCRPPRVWGIMGNQCIDQLSFWQAFAALNILLETALTFLPILMFYPLAMRKGRKATVIACFSARLLVVGALSEQIYEAQRLKSGPHDRTFDVWRYLLSTVIVHGVSIITACIPYIRHLLISMESGMIQTGHVKLPSRPGADSDIPLRHDPMIKADITSSGNSDANAPSSSFTT